MMPRFEDGVLNYRLPLVLGYDSANNLVMIGRWDLNARDLAYIPIECPLPFLP